MIKKSFGYLFCILSLVISAEASRIKPSNKGSFFEHSNITFQKKYESYWEKTFNSELTNSPEELAKRFTTALEQNVFLLSYPKPFNLGLSSSAYQFEGGIGEESSWHRFALKRNEILPGNACNFWVDYKAMIQQIKEECHINSFRLSISWERIQKTISSFDYEALAHYKKIIQELKNNGIEPLVVFHHYTVPTWFEDLGGFTKEDNSAYFVKFAKEVYKTLADEVTYWSTFNAIEGYAFKGYYTLDGAPGITKNMQTTVEVMSNMLKSHVAIYKAIKGIEQEQSTGLWQKLQKEHPEKQFPCPQIGIQKNIIFLDIAYDTWAHYIMAKTTWALCCMGNLMQNEGFYTFFNTGNFKVYIPCMVDVSQTDPMAPYTLDWIGVNHYANQKRYLMAVVEETTPLLKTLNRNYRYYPQGLYRAVKTVHSRINKKGPKTRAQLPVWITENGIADYSARQRKDFFQKTLFIVTKLVEEQLPIIGYTPWAAFDNYEWGSKALGEKRYGMFHVDFDDLNKKPILKNGSHFFAQFAKAVSEKSSMTIIKGYHYE